MPDDPNPPHRGKEFPAGAVPADPRSPRLPVANPLPFLFELGGDPVFDHPLWTARPETVPSLRIDTRLRGEADGLQTWAPASGPADTVYAFITRLCRYIERFGPNMGPANRPFKWFAIPAQFGGNTDPRDRHHYPNAEPLLSNPADTLRSGRRGPFARRGIQANRAWAREMLEHLADELRRQHLPDPIAFILTSENGVGDDNDGHFGDPDRGWVPEALGDPRSGDPAELVDGRRTFAQYFHGATSLDGGPVPPFRHDAGGWRPLYHPANAECLERARGALRLLWDYTRDRAFGSIAREVFRRDPEHPERTVRIGEYLAACDSKKGPVRWRPRSFQHQMDGAFLTDLQCPGWYGGMPWLKDESLTLAHPGWETLTNWLNVFPNDLRNPADQREHLGLDTAKATASANAGAAPHRPLAPFVSETAGLTRDAAAEYLGHCRALGAWCAIVFMPRPTRRSHDFWFDVVRRVNG